MFPRDAFRAAKVDSKSNEIKRTNSVKMRKKNVSDAVILEIGKQN